MKTVWGWIAWVILLMGASLAVGDDEVGNLIRNGSFERVNAQGVPLHWSLHPQADGEVGGWDDSMGESSKASVRLHSPDASNVPHWQQGGLVIQPNTSYELSFYVRADQFGSEFRAEVQWMREGESAGASVMDWEQTMTQWQLKTLMVRAPVDAVDSARVVLQGRSGTLWFDNVVLTPAAQLPPAPPVSLRVLVPHYRNAIYATQKVDVLRAEVRVDRALTSGRLIAVLRDANDSTIERQEHAWSGGETMVIEMPAEDLEVGDHALSVMVEVEGHRYGESRQRIQKLGPNVPEVRVDEIGVVRVDGEPFWPIGITSLPIDEAMCERLSSAGFNLMVANRLSRDGESLREQVALAQRFGLYVIDWNNGHVYPAGRIDAEEQRRRTQRDIENVKNVPGFLGWMVDEPLWNGARLRDVRRFYDEVVEHDPFHLVWNSHAPRNTVEDLAAYNHFTDITGTCIYPVPEPQTHSNLANQTISVVGDETRKLIRTVDGRKPVWMILQGFGWHAWNKDESRHRREPTWDETRFMAYDAIIHGADGIIYWGMHYVKPDSPLWDHILRMAGELSVLRNALVLPDAPQAAAFVDETEHMAMRIKALPEGLLLIVQNASSEEREVAIKPVAVPTEPVTVLFEDRAITLREGLIRETLAPYSARLYLLAPRLP